MFKRYTIPLNAVPDSLGRTYSWILGHFLESDRRLAKSKIFLQGFGSFEQTSSVLWCILLFGKLFDGLNYTAQKIPAGEE